MGRLGLLKRLFGRHGIMLPIMWQVAGICTTALSAGKQFLLRMLQVLESGRNDRMWGLRLH